MRRTILSFAVAAATLAVPAVADAHVLVIPNTAAAGAELRLDIRVPNEMDNATTTKVQVQLPPGFAEADYQPVPGWKTTVEQVKLNPPIKTDDGTVTEGVGELTWTADSPADGVPVGGFQDFGLEVLIPGKAGDTLTFKALQTYSNGQVVRWIGDEGSDTPAPTVKVTATAADDGAAAAPTATATPAATAAPVAAKSSSSNGLAIAALVVGVLAFAAGIAALLIARRRPGVRA